MAEDVSSFDPEAFLNSETEGGFDTTMTSVPPGDYLASIDKVVPRKFTDRNGNERVVMDVTWAVQDDGVKKELGLDKPTVRQSLFLDIENGGLARGTNKNIGLGKLLDAVGMNNGKPWSPGSLVGNVATIKVEHTPNENDPENPYSNVKAVASA